jgi:hypothetical protein
MIEWSMDKYVCNSYLGDNNALDVFVSLVNWTLYMDYKVYYTES